MQIKLKYFFLYLLVFLMLAPVAIPLGGINGKSVDIVLIDVFTVFSMSYLLRYNNLPLKSTLIFTVGLFIFYVLCLSLIGSIIDSSYVNMYSGLKYAKPWVILAVFYILAAKYPVFSELGTFKVFTRVSVIMIMSLLGTQFLITQSYMPRWGGSFYGIDSYGFPNTTGQYLGILVCIMLLGYSLDKSFRFMYLIACIGCLILSAMTLSRSGLIVVVIAILLSIASGRLKGFMKFFGLLAILSFIVGFISHFYADGEILSDNVSKLSNRLGQLGESDPLNGRLSVWSLAATSVYESPLFGAMFAPFSSLSQHHQSVHSQYLESLYKTGVLGSALFFACYFLVVYYLVKAASMGSHLAKYALISWFSISVGSITQPNFTDSLVGGVLFAFVGWAIGVRRRYEG